MAWAARCGGGRCCGGRRGGGFDNSGCGSRCGGTVFGRPGWLDGGQGSGSQEVRAACPQSLDRCRHVVREGLCLQQIRMESTCFVGFQMYYRDPAQPAGVRRSQDPWRRRLRVATEREWDLVVGLARRWSGLMLPTPAGNEVDRPSFLPRRPRGHGVAGGPTPGRFPGRRRTRSVVRGLRRGRPCLVPRCCCGRPCPVPRRPTGCRARGTCGARAALARSAVRPSPVLTPPWAATPRVWSTGPLGSSRPGAWPVRCAKINGGARPNVSGVVSDDPDDQFARSSPPSASPTRPVMLPASSPDGLDARGGASLQSLRSLLLDALERISFLTEEVAFLSEDNARLRREQRQQAELQASSIACLRADVRSLRDVLGKRARTDAGSSGRAL
ncbi:hypothetical protein ISCGN_013664 [Ixodes scapularis]